MRPGPWWWSVMIYFHTLIFIFTINTARTLTIPVTTFEKWTWILPKHARYITVTVKTFITILWIFNPQTVIPLLTYPTIPNDGKRPTTYHVLYGNFGRKSWYNGINSHFHTALPLLCKFNTHCPSNLTSSDQTLTHRIERDLPTALVLSLKSRYTAITCS